MIFPSAEDARSDLERLIGRGFDLDFHPPGPLGSQRLRRSAVLILFGHLDRIRAVSEIDTVSPGLDVLLIQRSEALRHHPGQISFPGGGVEPADRGPEGTALREAHEETGLDPAGVEILGTLPDVQIPVSNNQVTPVIAWWSSPSPVRADQTESVEVFRAPVAELLDPAARGSSVLRRGELSHRGEAFRLRNGGRIVWGFTGIILSRLFDGLGWSVPWDAEREFAVLG